MYELWSVSEMEGEILPMFLIDKGDFSKILPKFNQNKQSIITNKKGDILKTHYKL